MNFFSHRFVALLAFAAMASTPFVVWAQTTEITAPPPAESTVSTPPSEPVNSSPPAETFIVPPPSSPPPAEGEFKASPPDEHFEDRQPGGFTPPGGSGSANSGPPPGEENFQRPGSGEQFGGRGSQGPSEEDVEKMEKRREEQEKKMRARGLQQMQKGMKQFSRALTKFKTRMDKLEKQGVPIPTECKAGVANAETLVQNVLTAEDLDTENFDSSELQSAGDVLRECSPQIEQLAQLPRIVRQVRGQLTRLEKQHTNLQKRATKSGVDASKALAEADSGIKEIKTTLDQLTAAPGEDAFEVLQEMPEKFDTIRRHLGGVEAVFQLQKTLKGFSGQLRNFEQRVKRLEAKKQGTEARATLGELKKVLAELKAVQADEDSEEAIPDLMQQAWELREQLQDDLGIDKDEPVFNVKGGKDRALPELNIPQFEKLFYDQQILKNYLAKSHERAQVRYERARTIVWENAASAVAGVKIGGQ